MLSSDTQNEYRQRGYIVARQCLSPAALQRLREESLRLEADLSDPGRVVEADGRTVRGLHGSHLRNPLMKQLCSHPVLLGLARGLLQDEVYVHQFKLNVKAAFVGDVWEWHQDMTFYHREDEVPRDAFLTVAVLLDEVTEFNAPLLVIPGSHLEGFQQAERQDIEALDRENSWLSNTTAKLRYTADRAFLRALVQRQGMAAVTGHAGDCIVFHANLFHASGVNMSPFDRRVAFISYNSVNNRPQPTRPARPAFLCARDHTPLQPCLDEALA